MKTDLNWLLRMNKIRDKWKEKLLSFVNLS